jgi:hypothetical protein
MAKLPPSDKKPKFSSRDCSYIIKKFLKSPDGKIKQETAPAAIVLNRYPDLSFWKFFEIPFKLESLWWFNSDDGKTMVDKAYRMYRLVSDQNDSNAKVILSETDLAGDVKEIKQKSNLINFLRNGK